jgi:hypothetical protein
MELTPLVGEVDAAPAGFTPLTGEVDQAAPEPSGLLRRAVADPALGLLKGAVGVPEAAVGLADLVTGGYAGKGAEALGFQPKKAKEIISTWQSPELQQAQQEVQAAKGFIPTVQKMVENPSTIVDAALESAPSMLGGAGVARGVLKVVPKVATSVAAGIGEGVFAAGQSAEQVRQQADDGTLSLKQTILPIVSGAITGAIGVAGGVAAKKFNIGDVDVLLAGGSGAAANKNLLRRIAEGAFSEGLLEELPQSAQEQVAQNLALNKPWNEGVAEAAASGMLVGGLMGVSANLRPKSEAAPDPLTQINAALLEAVNPNTDTTISDALEINAQNDAAATATELAPRVVEQAIEDDKAQEALALANDELARQLDLPDLSTPVDNTTEPTPEPFPETVDPETGEVTQNPLDALKPYKNKEAAYKEIKKRGQLETHETAVRSDGKTVIVEKAKPVISEPAIVLSDVAQAEVGEKVEAPKTQNVTPGGKPVKVAENEVVALNAEGTQAVWAWESQKGEVFKTYADVNDDGSVDIFSPGIEEVDRISAATAFRAAGLNVVDSKGQPYAFGGEFKNLERKDDGRANTPRDTEKASGSADAGRRVQDQLAPLSLRPAAERLGLLNKVLINPKTNKVYPAGAFQESADSTLRGRLAEIAGVFGHDVTLLADIPDGHFDGGVWAADRKNIYISESVESPHLAILGHEIAHQMERNNRPLYLELAQAFIALKDNAGFISYMQEFHDITVDANGELDVPARITEEWVGDVLGQSMSKQAFWDLFYEEQPSLAARIAQYIHDLIESVKDVLFTGRVLKSAKTIKDLKAVDSEAVRILKKYAIAQKGATDGKDTRGVRTRFFETEKAGVVAEGGLASTFRNPDLDSVKFAARISNPSSQTAVSTALNSWFTGGTKNMLKDVLDKTMRFIMPTDRTITMAASQANYAPIKKLLEQYKNQRQGKAGEIQAAMGDAQHVVKLIDKAFPDTKALSDLVFKATEYQLHSDGAASGWTQETWEKSGHTDKTLVEAQAELTQMYRKFTPAQKVAHKAMIDQIQAVYLKGREAALAPWKQAHGNALFNQAEAYLEKEDPAESQEVKDLATTVKLINDRFPMLKGDYMPLMRFGGFSVRTVQMDENGELGKRVRTEFFDSQQDAITYTDRINNNPDNGLHAVLETTQSLGERNAVNIPAAMIDKLKAAAEARGVDGEALAQLIQDAEALRINMMPRTSTSGHKLKREGVEGYSTNVLKVFASYVRDHANANAGLIHGTKIEQTFRDMGNQIKAYTSETGYDPKAAIDMDRIYKHLYENERTASREKINGFVQGLGKASFLWYLSSPSIWAVQWSQPFMVTIPKMAAKYGYSKAFKAYTQAAKQYLHGDFSDEKIDTFNRDNNFIGDKIFDLLTRSREEVGAKKVALEREIKGLFEGVTDVKNRRLVILKVLSLQGRIDLSASHSLQDLAAATNAGDRFVDKMSQGGQHIMDKAGFFMQHSETGSRRAAAIASFEMAVEKEGFVGANDYAADIINDTLFDFDSANRGKAWQGNTGHILGQFQFFRMHMLGKMIQLVKDSWKGQTPAQQKESRKELAYMLGTSFALAGAGGTPLALAFGNTLSTALWGALAFMFGDDDDPWDPKRDFEMAVRESLGDVGGSVVLKGLPSLIGMDISQRIGLGGMGDVVMGDPPAGVSGTAKANWYAGRLLGPAWGMVSDTMRASDALSQGDIAKAIQYSSPKVLRDFVKTYEMGEHGVQGGGKTILKAEDVNAYSYALMMVGINPLDVSLASEESRYLKNLSTSLSSRRSGLIKDLASATADGDLEAKEEAIEKLNKWSAVNPKLRVTAQELATGIKKERKKRDGTLTKKEQLIKAEYGA